LPAHWLVLDAEGITHIDTTGMETLGHLVDELHEDGVMLVVARIRTDLKRHLGDAGLERQIDASRFYPTVHAAVGACVSAQTTNGGR
jgi:sulfate permease, SulP family